MFVPCICGSHYFSKGQQSRKQSSTVTIHSFLSVVSLSGNVVPFPAILYVRIIQKLVTSPRGLSSTNAVGGGGYSH